jgi:hypothetical protein
MQVHPPPSQRRRHTSRPCGETGRRGRTWFVERGGQGWQRQSNAQCQARLTSARWIAWVARWVAACPARIARPQCAPAGSTLTRRLEVLKCSCCQLRRGLWTDVRVWKSGLSAYHCRGANAPEEVILLEGDTRVYFEGFAIICSCPPSRRRRDNRFLEIHHRESGAFHPLLHSHAVSGFWLRASAVAQSVPR